MDSYLSTRRVAEKSSGLAADMIAKPEAVVESGIAKLDRCLGGFKAGEVTLVDGDSVLVSSISNLLCVNTYRTFHSDTVYVDAGMGIDPYKITRYAQMMEVEPREVLEHVHVSRAFTVYQLSTLLQDMLEPLVRRHRPRTLIIGGFITLFFDPDISSQESQVLLANNVKKIRELTVEYYLITIFTNLDNKVYLTRRGLSETLYSNVDEIVRMKRDVKPCIHVELVKRATNTFRRRQMRLQDFRKVI